MAAKRWLGHPYHSSSPSLHRAITHSPVVVVVVHRGLCSNEQRQTLYQLVKQRQRVCANTERKHRAQTPQSSWPALSALSASHRLPRHIHCRPVRQPLGSIDEGVAAKESKAGQTCQRPLSEYDCEIGSSAAVINSQCNILFPPSPSSSHTFTTATHAPTKS